MVWSTALAKQSSTETLVMGAAVAAGAAFLWSKREALFPGLAPPAGAAAVTPASPYLPTTTPLPASPIISAPVSLPAPAATYQIPWIVQQTTANTVMTPSGPVVTSNLDTSQWGCVVGPYGGIICPDAPAAVVPYVQ